MSLSDDLKELRGLLPELRALQGGGTNMAKIEINAGGVASISACMIAAVCMIVMIALAFQQQKTDTRQDADIREQRAQLRRADDYQNMLWRTYPELRESALKANEDRQNGKPDRL